MICRAFFKWSFKSICFDALHFTKMLFNLDENLQNSLAKSWFFHKVFHSVIPMAANTPRIFSFASTSSFFNISGGVVYIGKNISYVKLRRYFLFHWGRLYQRLLLTSLKFSTSISLETRLESRGGNSSSESIGWLEKLPESWSSSFWI